MLTNLCRQPNILDGRDWSWRHLGQNPTNQMKLVSHQWFVSLISPLRTNIVMITLNKECTLKHIKEDDAKPWRFTFQGAKNATVATMYWKFKIESLHVKVPRLVKVGLDRPKGMCWFKIMCSNNNEMFCCQENHFFFSYMLAYFMI